MYTLEYTRGVLADMKGLRTADRRTILDTIEKQLQHTPARATKNKKILVGLKPPWEHQEPVWELRIGQYRVFYDVNEREKRVIVRAVREKPPHKTTEEILLKVVNVDDADLEECVRNAQREGVVLTRRGKPVALLLGTKGLDLEQIELGHSDEFWKLIRQRRKQKTMSREELEKRLAKEK